MMIEAARHYIEMGYSVIPLKPGAKEPLVKWQEFTQRYANEKEISTWFGSDENNVGIAAGKLSGFVVVDVDGEEGMASAQKLSLHSSMIALTGKGRQYFYKYPTGVTLKNSVRFLPGLDIRSEGGYVCAPPSIHPNGKRYVWLAGPSPELPELPPSVIASIAKSDETPRPSGLKVQDQGWISEALTGLKGEGNRNDTFARVVGSLHRRGLDKATIWTLLLPYARACQFEERELNSVLQSITRYPNDISAESAASSAEQFLADSTPTDWLCDPICAKGSIGFTAGLPESCKTWILMDMAIECARGGGLWLGLHPIGGGRVLFIDQERAKKETQRRFIGLLKGKGLTPTDIKSSLFLRAGTSTRINLDESFNALKREIGELRPDLVIVDSFRTFHTLSVNSSQDMQLVMERVKELRNEFGCAIIFVDHNNKADFQDIRDGEMASSIRLEGAVAKSAAAESVLSARRTDAVTCAVFHTKNTLGWRAPSFAVHVMDTPDGGIRVWGEQGVKA